MKCFAYLTVFTTLLILACSPDGPPVRQMENTPNDQNQDTNNGQGTDSTSDADSDVDSDTDGDTDSDTGFEVTCDGESFEIFAGGYTCARAFHGYGWTAVDSLGGSSVVPTDYSEYTGGEDGFCATGSLTKDPAAYGMIGLCINQDESDSVLHPWSPGSDYIGLYVDIDNPGGSDIRIELGPAGDDVTYCAIITADTHVLDWSAFSKECWFGNGEPYAGEPIDRVILTTFGDASSNVDFNMCLNQIYPLSPT